MEFGHRTLFSSALVLMIVGIAAAFRADQSVAINLATGAGILLSAAGVMAALVIFARQSKQSDDDRVFHKQFIARTDGTLVALKDQLDLREQIGEGAAEQPDDDDVATDKSAGAGSRDVLGPRVDAAFGSDGAVSASVNAAGWEFPADSLGLETQGGNVIVYDPKDVKLWMIGEVVDFWKRQESSGRWNLSTLKGAAQKKGHVRNSWFLVFENPDTKELDYYRVSTGGRGKTTPTVTLTTQDDVATILDGNR